MNTKAIRKLSYGLYLLTAKENGQDNACIINTAVQVANNPNRISIAVIRENYTCDMILQTGEFNISAIAEDAECSLFQRFGMQSGRTADKFDGFDAVKRSENGLYYLTEASNAFLSAKVMDKIDLGSHILFIAEVTDGEILSDKPTCTYDHYQNNIKPKPVKSTKKRWVCAVCGYVYEGDELPDDFKCPICHHGKEDFVLQQADNPVEVKPVAKKKYVCPVCGYVYEAEEIPEGYVCPLCKCPGEKFTVMEEGAKLAAEHVFGIGTELDGVSAEDKAYILEQLKANFNGECSEVGMYLCMARVAHREGYPEIGLYWEKAAYEEAEHAAKFAELLGTELESNMTDSTAKNLAWRVDCEFGATQGKTDLAKVCKTNGLDALHDTIHEMARDEARHGRALKGMLDRYFGK